VQLRVAEQSDHTARPRAGFSEDFRRFFLRGLAALLPTLITISVLVWAWEFLWNAIGRHVIWLIKRIWVGLVEAGLMENMPAGYIDRYWGDTYFSTRLVGVLLAVVLVYIVGLLVGNLIGRTVWKLGEVLVMKIPVIRAIYPAVKQVTDFVLTDRNAQFATNRVVAVHARDPDVWSIGLVTGPGLAQLSQSSGQEMLTVFIPSSPTAFSGYVVVVPRDRVVELPLKVEEAMRLLVSGGVIAPGQDPPAVARTLRDLGIALPRQAVATQVLDNPPVIPP
jgi:uncharacterized membrane protein